MGTDLSSNLNLPCQHRLYNHGIQNYVAPPNETERKHKVSECSCMAEVGRLSDGHHGADVGMRTSTGF